MGCMNLKKVKQFWKGAPSSPSEVLIQIYFSHLATKADLNILREQRLFILHLVLILRSGVGTSSSGSYKSLYLWDLKFSLTIEKLSFCGKTKHFWKNALKMAMKYKLAKVTADIQDCYTNRSSTLLSFQTPSDSSHRIDLFLLCFVWQWKIWGIYMAAKIIVFENKPAMTFTPAQDHQVELSISIVHKISRIPEIQSVCSLN